MFTVNERDLIAEEARYQIEKNEEVLRDMDSQLYHVECHEVALRMDTEIGLLNDEISLWKSILRKVT